MEILVTGANGFVGSACCARLLERGFGLHAATRSPSFELPSSKSLKNFVVGDIDRATNWMPAVTGVEVVIHLAARVHVMDDNAEDPLAEFLKVNLDATMSLARQAATAGVRRFVYLSSIKVNGETSSVEKPFLETDVPSPQDPYAISKLRAEKALQDISLETGMELVIVRPPLVYGPGVRANFAKLMKSVQKGIPLPLGCVENKRSLVFVGNLCDALIECAMHPAAAGRTYLVSDGEDVSSAELARRLAQSFRRSAILLPIPMSLMALGAKLLGKQAVIDRLTQSLVIDSSRIREDLGWKPAYTLTQGLKITAEWCESEEVSNQA